MTSSASIPGGSILRRHESARRGFTLVEVLAAVAIFAILMVLTGQIIALTNNSALLSNRDADSAAEARLAFDRIAVDLAALVNRPDADFQAGTYDSSNTYNPSLLIYSSVGTATSSNRSLSTVAYAIQASADNSNHPCLMRAATSLPWTPGANFMGMVSGYPISISTMAPSAASYDVLAPGVICMSVGFQLYPDGQPVTLMDGSTVPNGAQSIGQIVYSPPLRSTSAPGNKFVDVSRIAAMVIGVITVDVNDLNQMTGAQVQTLIHPFTTTTTLPANGQLPVQAWAPTVQSVASNPPTGIFPRAAKSVQVYQRIYPITVYGGNL